MNRCLIAVLCVACAVAVGNIYFPQALTPLIATGFHVDADTAGLAVTATQLGYTAGMVLVVPLCDRVPHRLLLLAVLVATGVSLAVAGLAPTMTVLVGASFAVGFSTLAAQVVGPLVARLAGSRRGEVMGILLAGATGGMLLMRAVSGLLAGWLGWRAPYLLAAVLSVTLAVVLRLVVPATAPSTQGRYLRLLGGAWSLLRSEPDLRRSCFYQASVFAGFTAAWAAVALLLTGPSYGYGTGGVGLLALVGVGVMVGAPFAGRLVDTRGSDVVNLVCFLGVLASAALLAIAAVGGTGGLVALVAGMLVLEVGMQCGMVANQARMYAVRPDAGGRLNTVYMTCAYSGGTMGSFLGLRSYDLLGWTGVCALVAVLAAAALTIHLVGRRVPRRPNVLHLARWRSGV